MHAFDAFAQAFEESTPRTYNGEWIIITPVHVNGVRPVSRELKQLSVGSPAGVIKAVPFAGVREHHTRKSERSLVIKSGTGTGGVFVTSELALKGETTIKTKF
jgi:hypothetical protein